MTPERWDQVERIFHRALASDVSSRAELVARECAGDEALRLEVESLLAQEARAGSFLARPALHAAARALAGTVGADSRTLAPGTRVGPYEITALAGAGGMGEVYEAIDTRLDRVVAIKVLPPDVSGDPDRRTRFEREAKAIAALNHPHICTLHDVGERDGSMFLVMEHLAGQPLADRLQKGPLPLEQALAAATEIADALAAAHRQGVIHRDLKPGNVMLTKTGAKLLDFGLAKLTGHGEHGAVRAESVPVPSESLTAEGVILGTIQYMAPEQLEGRSADARTDIWALGACLYEMLTGQRAFGGGSQANVITAILSADPVPLSSVEPLTPPALERLVSRCLAKDPDERWDSAHDVADELRWIAGGLAGRASVEAHPWRPRAGASVAAGSVALGVLALVVWAVWLRSDEPVRRPSFAPVTVELTGRPTRRTLALSPTNRLLAYIGDGGGSSKIFLRSLVDGRVSAVPGTEAGFSPFFSPDGRTLAFFQGNTLKRVELPGGPVDTLVESINFKGGGSWASDGTIVYATDEGGRAVVRRIPAVGGAGELVLEAGRGEWYLHDPVVLPDNETLLVTAGNASCSGTRVVVQPHGGGPRRVLLERAALAGYVATGHVLFVQGGKVWKQPFDTVRAVLVGSATELPEPIEVVPSWDCGRAVMSVSNMGTLAFVPAGAAPPSMKLVWVDRQGNHRPVSRAALSSATFGPRPSPDGRRVALGLSAAPSVSVLDLRTGATTPLSSGGSAFWPVWTPDGQRVAFSFLSPDANGIRLLWRRADGSTPAEDLVPSAAAAPQARSFTPDMSMLVYQQGRDPATGFDIWVKPLKPATSPYPLLAEKYNEYHPSLSPDGKWLAYVSEEAGPPEVWIRPFPAVKDWALPVSRGGGLAPVWSRPGRVLELFYLEGQSGAWQSRVRAVRIDPASGRPLEAPQSLFEGPFQQAERYGQWFDVTDDGRFLMLRIEPPSKPPEVHFVFNWIETLQTPVRVK